MIDVDNQPDLEDVLRTLAAPVEQSKNTKKIIRDQEENMSDDDIYNFIISQLKDTIESNAEVLEQSATMVQQIGDPMVLDAHSKVVKSQADLLTNLLSTMMDRKKLEQNDKHKTRDLDLKERALNEKKAFDPAMLGSGTVNIQNNYLSASRDDLFDSLFENDPLKKQKAQLKIKEANGIAEQTVELDK